MSKGKIDSNSKRVTTDKKNSNVNNTRFDSKRLVSPAEEAAERIKKEQEGKKWARKKPHFYARYMRNASGYVSLTRTPESITDRKARALFKELVDRYEENNELQLQDLSKKMIMCRMLEYIEAGNTLLKLKDEAEQFLSYRFLFLDAVWLYLFKIFYPRIFDFEILNEDGRESIKFSSDYIEHNFSKIYKEVEILTYTIVYDSIIIATEHYLSQQISSLKDCDIKIRPADTIEEISVHLENQIKASCNPRIQLAVFLKPSIIFLAKYHHYLDPDLHDDTDDFVKKITTLLNQQGFYEGSRADNSRDALIKAYQDCREMLENISDPLTKLLNLYYINKKTYLFDFMIMCQNIEFAPYALNGIISKYHIDAMIVDNNERVNKPISEELELSFVYNNPNCIISNISSRDYEIIDFMITRSSKTIYEYYLKNGETDIPPSECESFIKAVNKDGYIGDLVKIIRLKKLYSIDKVDYEFVRNFISDGMKG